MLRGRTAYTRTGANGDRLEEWPDGQGVARAETRWIVVRISITTRTASRSSISVDSSVGHQSPRMRDQRPVYGSVRGALRLHPRPGVP